MIQNHHEFCFTNCTLFKGQQTPMYQTQPTTFLPLQQTIQPVYIGANMQYYNSGARQSPGYVQPSPYHMISGQQIAPYHPPFAASQNHQPQGRKCMISIFVYII